MKVRKLNQRSKAHASAHNRAAAGTLDNTLVKSTEVDFLICVPAKNLDEIYSMSCYNSFISYDRLIAACRESMVLSWGSRESCLLPRTASFQTCSTAYRVFSDVLYRVPRLLRFVLPRTASFQLGTTAYRDFSEGHYRVPRPGTLSFPLCRNLSIFRLPLTQVSSQCWKLC